MLSLKNLTSCPRENPLSISTKPKTVFALSRLAFGKLQSSKLRFQAGAVHPLILIERYLSISFPSLLFSFISSSLFASSLYTILGTSRYLYANCIYVRTYKPVLIFLSIDIRTLLVFK